MDEAGVHDRNARRTLLAFFRKINTLQNMNERMSWGRVSESDQMYADTTWLTKLQTTIGTNTRTQWRRQDSIQVAVEAL